MDEKVRLTNSLRNEIVGIDTNVPCIDGSQRKYIFLDNAASTPAFKCVLECIENFTPWYSAVHRGTGYKSILATAIYDRAHEIVGKFVGTDLSLNSVIFVKNTTEAINKLANRFNFLPDDIVITTAMEHHSNDLPWRKYAKVIHVPTDPIGVLNISYLKDSLNKYKTRVKLVAIIGASNITGYINPYHEVAELAHKVGAKIFLDAAQLTPHRKINILSNDNIYHIDFIAFSAHKMYAPFGTGVLIGPKSFFEEGAPDMVGGGTVEIVTLDDVYWTHPPFKDEAGSPNVIGAVALARAILKLEEYGMGNIAEHELKLLEYTYEKLKQIPEIIFYGDIENLQNKVGVITFNLSNIPHSLVASILGYEGGIGVRSGCFCAHPYVKKLLNVNESEERILTEEIKQGNKSNLPGMVRASFGCYNNYDDVDRFIEMLKKIIKKDYCGNYVLNQKLGIYTADGFDLDLEKYFPIHKEFKMKDDIHYPESA